MNDSCTGSRSPARDRYWLKGALLFDLWFGVPHRPTRDADFLGFGPADTETLRDALREICVIAFEDGMTFDPDSLVVEEIREDARYGGLRARLVGRLGNARSPVRNQATRCRREGPPKTGEAKRS